MTYRAHQRKRSLEVLRVHHIAETELSDSNNRSKLASFIVPLHLNEELSLLSDTELECDGPHEVDRPRTLPFTVLWLNSGEIARIVCQVDNLCVLDELVLHISADAAFYVSV